MKKVLPILGLFQLIFVATYSQPIAQWANSSEGLLNDHGNSVAVDSAGNVYVVGDMSSNLIDFGNGVMINNSTMFIVKYNDDGFAQWAHGIGNETSDEMNSVAIGPFGDVYVTGQFGSNILDFGNGVGLTNAGEGDMFLVKYDSNGVAQWARGAGGTEADIGRSVAVSAAGNVYVTGGFKSDELHLHNLAPVSNYGAGDVEKKDDMFLIKYNNLGNEEWIKTFASDGYSEVAHAIALDNAENIYLVGELNVGVNDVFVVKYDSAGDGKWLKAIAGVNSVYDVAVDSEGNAYVTGGSAGEELNFLDGVTISKTSSEDMYVVKYSTDGITQWANAITGSDEVQTENSGKGIGVDDQGNVYVTGYFLGSDIDFGNSITLDITEPTELNTDVFLVCYNSNGVAQWAEGYGTGGNDVGDDVQSITIDHSNNLYLTGGFRNSTLDFGNGVVINSIVEQDMFVVKLTPPNSPPGIDAGLTSQVYSKGFKKAKIDLSKFFSDPDGDELTFHAVSKDTNVVSVAVAGSSLKIFERGTGKTTISLTAGDEHGAQVNTSFKVTVLADTKRKHAVLEMETMLVYPNPMDTHLQIALQGEYRGDLQIQLLDMTGKTMEHIIIKKYSPLFKYTLDVSSLPRGIYLLNVKQGTQQTVTRVVKWD